MARAASMQRAAAMAAAAMLGLALLAESAAASAPREPSCKSPTIEGTDGRDRIRASNGADVIAAGGGDDRILRLGGGDLVCGGGGADVLRGERRQQVAGASRVDFLPGQAIGGPGPDRIILGCPTGVPSDKGWEVWAEAGDDEVAVDCGNYDIVDGGPGADTLRLGRGNDWAYGRDGDDVIVDEFSVAGDCADPEESVEPPPPSTVPRGCVYLFPHDDTLIGNAGDDRIFGGEGPDLLFGDVLGVPPGDGSEGWDDPTYSAEIGKDELHGGADDDGMVGGLLDDLCDGGGGLDYNGAAGPFSVTIHQDCERLRSVERGPPDARAP